MLSLAPRVAEVGSRDWSCFGSIEISPALLKHQMLFFLLHRNMNGVVLRHKQPDSSHQSLFGKTSPDATHPESIICSRASVPWSNLRTSGAAGHASAVAGSLTGPTVCACGPCPVLSTRSRPLRYRRYVPRAVGHGTILAAKSTRHMHGPIGMHQH